MIPTFNYDNFLRMHKVLVANGLEDELYVTPVHDEEPEDSPTGEMVVEDVYTAPA